jgi:hypothetical protein
VAVELGFADFSRFMGGRLCWRVVEDLGGAGRYDMGDGGVGRGLRDGDGVVGLRDADEVEARSEAYSGRHGEM